MVITATSQLLTDNQLSLPNGSRSRKRFRLFDIMKAIDFLDKHERNLYETFCFLPSSCEGDKLHDPSRSELKRWLNKGSVLINGEKPKPQDDVIFPITELVYFPNSRSRTTMA